VIGFAKTTDQYHHTAFMVQFFIVVLRALGVFFPLGENTRWTR